MKSITKFILEVGDSTTEQGNVDSVLDGLLEEYKSFGMQMYGSHELFFIFDIEALIYVQKAHLDKFKKKLVILNVSTNLAHVNTQTGGTRV